MIRLLLVLIATAAFCFAAPQTSIQKKAASGTSKKAAVIPRPPAKKAVAPKSHPRSSSSRVASSRSRYSRKAPAPRRVTQQQPSRERYAEIQQALAGRGYYQGEANGLWGADSAAALRRFQEDQKLTADGKLSAMSLTLLGLGPKRTASLETNQAAPREQR